MSNPNSRLSVAVELLSDVAESRNSQSLQAEHEEKITSWTALRVPLAVFGTKASSKSGQHSNIDSASEVRASEKGSKPKSQSSQSGCLFCAWISFVHFVESWKWMAWPRCSDDHLSSSYQAAFNSLQVTMMIPTS